MRIFTAYVSYGSGIYKVDAIEWRSKLWLVPHWLDTPDGKWTSPGRIVRFDNLEHSSNIGSDMGDFVVSFTMPKELFGVRTPIEQLSNFEYQELPNILIDKSKVQRSAP